MAKRYPERRGDTARATNDPVTARIEPSTSDLLRRRPSDTRESISEPIDLSVRAPPSPSATRSTFPGLSRKMPMKIGARRKPAQETNGDMPSTSRGPTDVEEISFPEMIDSDDGMRSPNFPTKRRFFGKGDEGEEEDERRPPLKSDARLERAFGVTQRPAPIDIQTWLNGGRCGMLSPWKGSRRRTIAESHDS
ncbi:uncharacterized protein LOC100901708 [Galendromus occidentalis]|uniref:Uncharacterized protein LOC100901708 n=1 Tax=Galendromus occidentalis TaxID=34638 RepID=A0AAJ6QYW8_9ACAR|nr:uncharacterized protein LOC100901708 [Galendromus occidentalis]